MKNITVSPSILDKAIMALSPERGLKRIQSKMRYQALSNGGYIGADTNRRAMRSANAVASSPDSDLSSLEALRGIVRDMYRNTSLVRGSVDTMRFNIIGVGLHVQSQIDYEFLGLTQESARVFESMAEQIFRFWAESDNADVERSSNFYELQSIALIGALVSGDIFVALPYIKRANSPYSLSVQLIEADRCCNPDNKMDDEKIAAGIEVDSFGAPTFYHFSKFHPGGLNFVNEWKKIPVFSKNGRRNVLHVFEKTRPGQKRGVSILAPIIEPLKQFTDYTNAELTAAVVSGLFTVFIETEKGDGVDDEELDGGYDDASMNLEAGAIIGLAEGEKVTTANPNRPNTAFDGFTTSILKQIGAALNLPYEVLMKHFSSSYSASRAALLEAWKMFRTRREWFAHKFTQPIYEAVITEAVLLGHLEAPGFLEDPMMRKAYLRASWNGPSQGQLNPVQETKAALMRVEEGFSTRTKEASEMNGTDFDQNIKRAKSETDQMRESGLLDLKISVSEKILPKEDENA